MLDRCVLISLNFTNTFKNTYRFPIITIHAPLILDKGHHKSGKNAEVNLRGLNNDERRKNKKLPDSTTSIGETTCESHQVQILQACVGLYFFF